MSNESIAKNDVDSLDKELAESPKAQAKGAARPAVNESALATVPKAQPQRQSADDLERKLAPRSHSEWHSVTQANVFRVEALTRHVFDQVNQNTAVEQAARKAMQEHAQREKEKQRKKVHARVKVHQEFIQKTYKCMKEIEHSMVQVEGALGRLTAERYARFAGAKVSEHRLELREKRPGPELFRDGVQRLLEKELEALNAARKELLHDESEAKRLLEDLQRDWNILAKDVGNRRLAMRHDLGTIAAGEECDLYNSPEISNKRSNEIVENAYVISAQGLKIQDSSEALVKRVKNQAAVLNKQVEQSLAHHTKELASMKASLAQKIVESEGAIDKASTQLRHMEQRAELGDNSMNDMISTLKALLRDLHSNRQNSVKDLRNKSLALDIDTSCRKVTSQVATAPSDPKAKKQLAASQSAPVLGGASKMPASGTGWKQGAESCGNPQQGDNHIVINQEQRHAIARSPKRPTPSPSAGGSNPLKAAATAVVQDRKSVV